MTATIRRLLGRANRPANPFDLGVRVETGENEWHGQVPTGVTVILLGDPSRAVAR
ncbi:hypothetical protein ACWT_5855 [Actinoplanes sp. SE50]|uniref:hypothetical protein n=1 Tax=unclassified Actinoplanes TaxID=2626549 RepID=UPI00023EBDCB|nr:MULTISPECIES: hypothetical protein [unclassified Actinoplanes]AEV86873.1 hypothetical protein ACPL_5986 [Actinoplanes sp. SE50/110]ATO85270.1 hypothetical protein ACWT_5855 [Actinoplanes sp. SE50]SLM02680.1 hypothetical protein ACSP50_5962 [Actinoplanes sp. SE50/110]